MKQPQQIKPAIPMESQTEGTAQISACQHTNTLVIIADILFYYKYCFLILHFKNDTSSFFLISSSSVFRLCHLFL